MHMDQKINPAEYVWLIVERVGQSGGGEKEQFLGLEPDNGPPFIPVTTSRETAEALLAKMPIDPAIRRQVESMHQQDLRKHAGEYGYKVYEVDAKGHILARWPD